MVSGFPSSCKVKQTESPAPECNQEQKPYQNLVSVGFLDFLCDGLQYDRKPQLQVFAVF